MHLAGREVIVVGAGIGGLAAATALAQRGARVCVLEQAPALTEVGAGLQVAPNGVAVLEALGLRDAAERRATVPEAIELHDHRGGRAVARVPLGRDIAARLGRPYWQFHRADLLDILAAGATDAGAILVLGARVAAANLDAPKARLRLDDGRTFDAEVVVAADGVRSPLRQAHLNSAAARFTGHVAWRSLVPAERVPAELRRPVARVTMAPRRHVVSYPLRGGRLINLVAIEERATWTEEGWMAADDPANLRRAFAGWDGPAAALIDAVDSCWLWGLFDHAPLDRWVVGRLALLGDACHPMLPFLAQGATMALEDAWVLADCLDLDPDPLRALGAYEARRIGRATRVQRAAARSGRIYHLGPVLREPVQAGLRVVESVAPRLLAARFDWLFGYDATGMG